MEKYYGKNETFRQKIEKKNLPSAKKVIGLYFK